MHGGRGTGVADLRSESGIRGEVCVRRSWGREVMEFNGKPSGGINIEEDAEEELEATELWVLHTSTMG